MKRSFQVCLSATIFFVSFICIGSYSQSTFVHRLGSVDTDYGLSCQPTYDNGIILVETSSTNGLDLHAALVKTDGDGNMLWYKNFRVGDYSVPATVLQTKDEGYIVFGTATDSSFVNNNKHFLFLHKTNSIGNPAWDKQFILSDNDLALNLVHRKAGGFISFSVGSYNLGYPNMVVTTFEDNGDTIWSKQYDAAYGITGVKGIELSDSSICFVSTAPDPANSSFNDVVVTLLDPSGNILWSKDFGTYYDDEPYALASNASREIFITGRSYFINRNWDSFVMKLDPSGSLLQSKVYDAGTSNGEIMRCILVLPDGTVKLLGDMGTFNERDITLLNLDSSFAIASARRYTFSPLDTNYPYDFFEANDGGLIFTGDFRPPATYRDAILAKTESDGMLNCYTTSPAFSEINEIFHDTIFNAYVSQTPVTLLSFPTMIPAHIFSDHIVCALNTGQNEVLQSNGIIENVFPNPSQGKLAIKFRSDAHRVRINLYSSDGRVVYCDQTNENVSNYILNTEKYSAGIYILECGYSGFTERRKITIN